MFAGKGNRCPRVESNTPTRGFQSHAPFRRAMQCFFLFLLPPTAHEPCRKADYGGFDQGAGDPAQGDPAAAPVGRGHAAGGRGHAGRCAAQARAAVPGDEARRRLWIASRSRNTRSLEDMQAASPARADAGMLAVEPNLVVRYWPPEPQASAMCGCRERPVVALRVMPGTLRLRQRGCAMRSQRRSVVPRGGIEPPTLRFSVACSTN
jgi:hypothetical protein